LRHRRQSIDLAPPGPVYLNWIVRPDGTELKKVF